LTSSEKIDKKFGFPRWRSNDALTASLTASNGNVPIPPDSTIPEHRLLKRQQAEQTAAQQIKVLRLEKDLAKKLQKGKSLDSLIIQLDYQPWYDENQIRQAISRESIADFDATRKRFEYGQQAYLPEMTSPSTVSGRHSKSITQSI
uniref:Pre-mRNA-processing protein 45 n=1 Tax=Anisakis simplex TaxID=6269 RepID=A0A0M3JTS7_ANISI